LLCVLGGLLGLIAAASVATYRLDAKILRHDPDTLPKDRLLMRVAVWRGRPTFRSHCASCHGADGTGDTERGVPNLTDGDWLYGTGAVSDIERVVAYGIRSDHPKAWNLSRMPAFAHARPSPTDAALPPLSPAGIRDVVEYLYVLQNRPADTERAARGARIYHVSGGCYDCHSGDAKGDNAIGAPNLTDDITLYGDGSRATLFDSIANGRQGICPTWINELSAVALRDVASYVFSLSHPDNLGPNSHPSVNDHVQPTH
jgi:cytochrome c oxidase cbb3-type subunit 3